MYLYDEKRNRWISHRETAEYKRRKRKLRDYWIIGLLATIPLTPAGQTVLVVAAAFASLAFLDEAPYQLD